MDNTTNLKLFLETLYSVYNKLEDQQIQDHRLGFLKQLEVHSKEDNP